MLHPISEVHWFSELNNTAFITQMIIVSFQFGAFFYSIDRKNKASSLKIFFISASQLLVILISNFFRSGEKEKEIEE